MKNMSVERLVLGGFIVMAIVLALLGSIVWHGRFDYDQAQGQMRRSHQVLATVGQIMLNLTRAETAQRGYVMFGLDDNLKSRDESLLNVIRSVAEAERLIVDSDQLERLHKLKKLIVQRMEVFRLGKKFLGRKFRKDSDLLLVAKFDSNLRVMEQIHNTIGRMVEIENARLQERDAEYVIQRNIEYSGFVLLGVLLPLLLILLFLRIRLAIRVIRDEAVWLKKSKLQQEEENRKKSEFLAYISHELRTPVSSIMGFSELFKRGQLGKLTKKQIEYISDIHDNGQHVFSLVNDILDLSKAQAGNVTLDLAPVKISVLIRESISVVKEKIASQCAHLQLDVQPGLDDIDFLADPLKARQILCNLLSNAVKFMPGEGHLKLSARHVSHHEVGQVSGYWPSRTFPLAVSEFKEFLEISVADCGIGISREGLERLFQPYSRIESRSGLKFEGTGLGLMLVKHLVEMHSGTVAVESSEGHGARFIVWFPLRTNVEMAIASEERISQQSLFAVVGKTRDICVDALRELAQQRTFVNI